MSEHVMLIITLILFSWCLACFAFVLYRNYQMMRSVGIIMSSVEETTRQYNAIMDAEIGRRTSIAPYKAEPND